MVNANLVMVVRPEAWSPGFLHFWLDVGVEEGQGGDKG